MNSELKLTREDIWNGLEKISEIISKEGGYVELAVYGGSAVSLSFDERRVTRDVDITVANGGEVLKKASKQVAEDLGWPEDWLNDGVKGFVSGTPELNEAGLFTDKEGNDILRVFTPTPEYLLAMKRMSMRIGIEGNDVEDIKRILTLIEFDNSDQILDIIEGFYQTRLISSSTYFGTTAIVDDFLKEKEKGLLKLNNISPAKFKKYTIK